jgi:hypothetical protein
LRQCFDIAEAELFGDKISPCSRDIIKLFCFAQAPRDAFSISTVRISVISSSHSDSRASARRLVLDSFLTQALMKSIILSPPLVRDRRVTLRSSQCGVNHRVTLRSRLIGRKFRAALLHIHQLRRDKVQIRRSDHRQPQG